MEGNVVLKGRLGFLGLPDLLQFLGTSGSTGILRVTNPFAENTGVVYFLRGKTVHATIGPLAGIEALYALFGWKNGTFNFSQEKITAETTIHKSQMEIILDGLRRLDDGLIKKIDPDSQIKEKQGFPDGNLKIPFVSKPISNYALIVAEEEFPDQTKIVEEGEYGHWIWVVLDGTALFSKRTDKRHVKILKAGQGAFIGNISSVMSQGCRRIVTTTASGKVQLGVLDTQPLYDEYSHLSDAFRKVLLSLDKRFRETIERLSSTRSLDGRPEDLVQGRHNVAKLKKNMEEAFLIQKGKASVVRNMGNSYEVMANLNKEDFFGHIPFLDMGHEPHSAGILLSEGLKAGALDLGGLKSEYDQLSDIFRKMIEFTVTCISITTLMHRSFTGDSKKPGLAPQVFHG